MAEAYGKLTGRPGICFVTRGPGASNAAIGMHTALQDSTPLILFIGQVGSDFVEREAFQEIDYRRMYGSIAKWVAQIDRAERIPEYVARAFHVATSGRPGPVVLALPEDMLTPTRARSPTRRRYEPSRRHPPASQIDAAARAAGGAPSARSSSSAAAAGPPTRAPTFAAFAEANELPVACAFRCQDLFDNRHPNLCRRRRHRHQSRSSRRACATPTSCWSSGERLGEMTTGGYTLLGVPDARADLDPRPPRRPRSSAASISRRSRIQASMPAVRRALAGHGADRCAGVARQRPQAAHADYLAMANAAADGRRARSVASRRDAARAPARRRHHHQRRRQLHGVAAPLLSLSALSHPARALPAARWAMACPPPSPPRRSHPDRVVVSWNGDGCFHDERAGARDRRAIRAQRHLHRDRQRHVRHHPHAPGARIIRRASTAPTSSIPISPRSRAPTARTAKR